MVRVVVGALALVLVGCGSTVRPAQQTFRAGNIDGALASLERDMPRASEGNDAVLFWLEYGSVLHHAGQFERSSEALLEAEARMAALDARPATSVSAEAAALISNPNAVAYHGKAYDRVMSPLYRGINALLEGDAETPRQAFNEAALQLADAIAWRQASIDLINEERQAWSAGARQPLRVEQTMNDPTMQSRLRDAYGDLEQFQPYAGYGNPFAELLHAVYLLGVQQDGADADRARTMLRRVLGMVPGNAHVPSDLAAAEQAAATGQRVRGVTYVIFATGTAPQRESNRIDLPLFFFNDTVDYFGIALPFLVFDRAYEPDLIVRSGGVEARTQLVADMDRIIATDFQHELPLLVQRSLVSAAAKAAAAWGVNQAVDDDGWVGLGVRVGLIAYQYSQNTTDLRTWATLPKQFQYARIETPADGRITVQRRSGESVSFELDPDRVNIVYARSIGPGQPLLVRAVGLE